MNATLFLISSIVRIWGTNIYLFNLLYGSASRRGQFKIVPILVGALRPDKEAEYGRLFSKYLLDPENLFIISSDFCHWGELGGRERESEGGRESVYTCTCKF